MASTEDDRLRDIQQRLTGPEQGAAPAPAAAANPDPTAAGAGGGNGPNNSPRRPLNVPHRHIHLTVRTQQAVNNAVNNNNNNGEFPQQTQNLFHMRDRLFLALFFRISLIYARAFPKTLRRLLEFCLLMQSIFLLFILTYIHIAYNQTPITCLSEYKNSWPKDGILRVEITTDSALDYDVQKSYEKEERLRQKAESEGNSDLLTMMLTADTLLLNKMVSTAEELIQSVTSSKTDPTAEADTPEADPPDTTVTASESPPDILSQSDSDDDIEIDSDIVTTTKNLSSFGKEMDPDSPSKMGHHLRKRAPLEPDTISPSFVHTEEGAGNGNPSDSDEYDFDASDEEYFNKTVEEIEIIKMNKKKLAEEGILKSSVSDLEMFTNSVWLQDQAYIVEYALEYGFLRLSPDTRQRLNIPVKIVTLDPSKEACFGDGFSRFLLDNFLGYDDILMSSIKNLAESEDNKGYLRNVVTGEQFRFVPMWMARTAYIPALVIMLVFTVSISMLLRYSHHQIFVFIVDLLNNIEGVGAIHIPAAPLFTVILALVGMEAIMSEFFNDTSTAFYVILIVWIADQYDSVCSHTPVTRAYWVRFFYLYHFAFYAYHYRFNGQYGGLALLVSWSFIQHSMVYFYHHYELPTILRQAQQDDEPEVNVGHNIPAGNANNSRSSSATQTGAPVAGGAGTAPSAGAGTSPLASASVSSQPSSISNSASTATNSTDAVNSTTGGSNTPQSPANSSSPSHTSGPQRCSVTFSHLSHIPSGTPLAESSFENLPTNRTQGQSDDRVDPVQVTATTTASGTSISSNSANIIINTSTNDTVGLNVNLGDIHSPSTSMGLRLRINLPQRQNGEPSAFVPHQHHRTESGSSVSGAVSTSGPTPTPATTTSTTTAAEEELD